MVTLQADLASYKCAVDMIDGALEWPDVKVFKHTLNIPCIAHYGHRNWVSNKSWGPKFRINFVFSPH